MEQKLQDADFANKNSWLSSFFFPTTLNNISGLHSMSTFHRITIIILFIMGMLRHTAAPSG